MSKLANTDYLVWRMYRAAPAYFKGEDSIQMTSSTRLLRLLVAIKELDANIPGNVWEQVGALRRYLG